MKELNRNELVKESVMGLYLSPKAKHTQFLRRLWFFMFFKKQQVLLTGKESVLIGIGKQGYLKCAGNYTRGKGCTVGCAKQRKQPRKTHRGSAESDTG